MRNGFCLRKKCVSSITKMRELFLVSQTSNIYTLNDDGPRGVSDRVSLAAAHCCCCMLAPPHTTTIAPSLPLLIALADDKLIRKNARFSHCIKLSTPVVVVAKCPEPSVERHIFSFNLLTQRAKPSKRCCFLYMYFAFVSLGLIVCVLNEARVRPHPLLLIKITKDGIGFNGSFDARECSGKDYLGRLADPLLTYKSQLL